MAPTLPHNQDFTDELLACKLVEKHYYLNHVPLSFLKQRGAPYTDTSFYEKMPRFVYDARTVPKTIFDRIALFMMALFALILETIAAIPGMAAGMLRHFRSIRKMEIDAACETFLEEAENERAHLLVWLQLVQPTIFERFIVFLSQAVFAPFYTLFYLISPKVAHRFVGYLEEEATYEYTAFLHAIDDGTIPNVDAPKLAKMYWNLSPEAKLRDVVLCIRGDEIMHRDVNHDFSTACEHGRFI
ncbi:alternative oxidase [Planoprotostelium fungivorum]|uniref:Alternative oxidase n=1 Tax=Planoprotostelium fungivorum TaxID=1890364 RepID=A0A2P6P0W7_9EUKA|nr:alternative oxidase [Planoprotostelium fungivorum]